MAGEFIASLGVNDMLCEKSMGYDSGISSVLGYGMKIRGNGFPRTTTKGGNASYTGTFFVPNSITLATTTNFLIHVTDDGTNSADLGTNVYFGVTTKPLSSTAVTLDMDATADNHLGTEVTGSGTLSTASGGVVVVTVAVSSATGTIGSGATSGIAFGLRVRRMGEVAVDTCTGRVIVPLIVVKNP